MIVIGHDHANIRFQLGSFRPHPRGKGEICTASGDFCVPGLSGQFTTTVFRGWLEGFAAELEQLLDHMPGVVKFRTGEEHLGDLEIEIGAERLGRVHVSANVYHQPGFNAEFGFELDQSYLPRIIRALRSAL